MNVFRPFSIQTAAGMLLVVALLLAPAIGWAPSRLFGKMDAKVSVACCKAETNAPANDSAPVPHDPSKGCNDCVAGFCLCVGGVFVIDAPLALMSEATPQPLALSAQLSVPESSSLEDIFHPPRA